MCVLWQRARRRYYLETPPSVHIKLGLSHGQLASIDPRDDLSRISRAKTRHFPQLLSFKNDKFLEFMESL